MKARQSLHTILGHKVDRDDGHVYRDDKKTHQKRDRASNEKYQRRNREIDSWNCLLEIINYTLGCNNNR